MQIITQVLCEFNYPGHLKNVSCSLHNVILKILQRIKLNTST